MSALAEALLAAQRSAIGAMGKPYIAGAIDVADVEDRLRAIGATDQTDSRYLLSAWDTIREFGAQPPPATGQAPPTEPEPASERQTAFITKLAEDRGVVAPDGPLTKEQASKVIEQLKAGTYNPDEWTVPF